MTEDEALECLGVRIDADRAAIASAFRSVARDCHPDMTGGDRALATRFSRAAEAWHLLDRRLREGGGRLSEGAYTDVLAQARTGSADLADLHARADDILQRLSPSGITVRVRILRIHVERIRNARTKEDAMRIGREALRPQPGCAGRGLA